MSALLSYLPDPSYTGISAIFRGRLKAKNKVLECFIKPHPDHFFCPVKKTVPNQEVVSEALAYTLAKTCGLSVATNAGIILLSRNQIPLKALGKLPYQDDYICWFCEDALQPNLSELYCINSFNHSDLYFHLVNSTDTLKIIAFDSWLKNSDRNIGNLLYNKNKKIHTLIDHGRVFIYPNWCPGYLGSLPNQAIYENKLLKIINQYSDSFFIKNHADYLGNFKKIEYYFNRNLTKYHEVLMHFFKPEDAYKTVELLDIMLQDKSRL